jgi:hypothetical protein
MDYEHSYTSIIGLDVESQLLKALNKININVQDSMTSRYVQCSLGLSPPPILSPTSPIAKINIFLMMK